jgi:hypothetical protein
VPGAFYIRAIANGDTRSIGATPYDSKEAAAHVILRHLLLGSIKRGWVVNELDHIVISAEDILALFHSTQKPD